MRHPHYDTARASQVAEARLEREAREIIRSFKDGVLAHWAAVKKLQDLGCFEAEISERLGC